MNEFKQGDVIVWDGANQFNPDYWDELSEEDRVKYYSDLGYGAEETKCFIYMTEIYDSPEEGGKRCSSGHCIIIDFQGNITTMVHTIEFRLATEDEF